MFRKPVPCVTFDQPLYINASDISTAAALDIVSSRQFSYPYEFIPLHWICNVWVSLEDMLAQLPSCIFCLVRCMLEPFQDATIQDTFVQCLLPSIVSVDCNAAMPVH